MGGTANMLPMIMQGASMIAQQAGSQNAASAQAQSQADQINLQNQLLVQQQDQQAKQQRDLLKRQVASARAALAAGAGGAQGGSGAALLAGLSRQSAEDIAAGFNSASLRQQQLYARLNQDEGGSGTLALANQAFSVLKPLFGNGS
ncbi:hypothetical protein [Magnetospirillum sulfuroxidans]|uniref:Uncharacterized protein n=1 Tax=Magnetospirillum sulfuroxidans TaxID=611300 RepID=A0ABS5I9R7_9PROT|nr:hypothetical protein [Magnetospirillum sulfuroxidans]MBR9971173.1 hypothetical protein [Magnetospirillum sulfuroxidans]